MTLWVKAIPTFSNYEKRTSNKHFHIPPKDKPIRPIPIMASKQSTITSEVATLTVEEYLTQCQIPYAYVSITEVAKEDAKKGIKWVVEKTIWCGSNKVCTWSKPQWKRHAGNKRSGKAFEPRPAIAKVGTRRENDYLAYASSPDHVVLDIDDEQAFADAYPEIDLASTPRYLSRNKRLAHAFVDLTVGNRRKFHRKGVKGIGGVPVADLCTGQMLWVRPEEPMIMPDAPRLPIDVETFFQKKKRAKKIKAKKAKKAKKAPKKTNCTVPCVQETSCPEPPSDDEEAAPQVWSKKKTKTSADDGGEVWFTPYSDKDRYPNQVLMKAGLSMIADRYCRYIDWYKIGTILKMIYGPQYGLQLFTAFSKDRPGWVSADDVRDHFDRFDVNSKSLTIGTIYYYMRESDRAAYALWRESTVGERLLLAGDIGLADAYHMVHGAERLRLVSEKGGGFLWNDSSRLWEETGKIVIRGVVARQLIKCLQITVHRLRQEAADNAESGDGETTDSKTIKGLKKVVGRLRMSNGQRGVVEQVMNTKCLCADFITDVNSSKHELAIRGGYVLDLRTGQSRLRTPRDKFSFELDVSNRGTICPDAMADAQRFFLSIANGDQELADYIISVLGYGMTGENTQHKLFVFWGSGSNGKSTLVDILSRIMMKYYSPLAENAMIDNGCGGGGATPELMCLLSARLAILSESRAGAKLNDTRIKAITGGDKLTIRALYGDPIEVQPCATMCLMTNEKPDYGVANNGMRRRVVMVPFEATFKATPENQAYVKSLSRPECLDAIFSLLVQGAMEYYRNGTLRKPAAACTRVTNAHNNELDTVGAFLAECAQPSKRGWPCASCYEAYTEWCEDSAKRPLTSRMFHSNMTNTQKILKSKKPIDGKRQSFFVGIEKKVQVEPEESEEEE